MIKTSYLTFLLFISIFWQTSAQNLDSLRHKIQHIISAKNAVVGIAISGPKEQDTLSVNGNRHFPLQSVYKFHIAIVVLSQVDKGKFSLEQKIQIEKKDLLPGLYSPIRDKYPEGTTLTLAEILKYTVSESDNVGCDLLLRLLGGPKVVENYFREQHFNDISIKTNEETQQANWDLQFQNWTTPKTANIILATYYENKKKLLSQKSYDFIWKTMKETTTGKNRLKGLLPQGTTVAHKTGSSGTHETTGVTAAVNDIGIVFLPKGQHFLISVFVGESNEDDASNEKIIADIAKAAYEYYAKNP